MIGPTEILPQALGLQWGMSKGDCLRILNRPILGEVARWAVVILAAPSGSHDMALLFDEGGGLERIEVELYVSRSFWDCHYTREEEQHLRERYSDLHDAVVSQYESILGEPCFHGPHHTEGHPNGQCADHLAYWCAPGTRIQVELDRCDREFPFVVRVVTCPVEGECAG